MDNWGLVLSGGGAKGMVHAGVLKWLDKHDLKPKLISGSSVGAMVGALYSAGHTPEEILDIFIKESIFSTSHITFRKPGLIDTTKLRKVYKKYFEHDDFGELSIPIYIVASNLLDGKVKVFDSGPLVDALLASSAFPLVFTPMKIDNQLYLDGGILNHFPVDVIQGQVDKTLGVYLSPIEQLEAKDLNSVRSITERTFRLGRHAGSRHNLELCNLIIDPGELTQYNTFSVSDKKLKKLFEIGFETAQKRKDEIFTLLKNN